MWHRASREVEELGADHRRHNLKLLAVARGLVSPSKRRSERHRAHVRWVWLPSPGRVALQRSCALQLLQFIDSTIELAMLPRRFDCFNSTRVAHAHDDLSRQPQPPPTRHLHSPTDKGSSRPCKAPFVQPSVLVCLARRTRTQRLLSSRSQARWFNEVPVELRVH